MLLWALHFKDRETGEDSETSKDGKGVAQKHYEVRLREVCGFSL